jgi:hypothetical protein
LGGDFFAPLMNTSSNIRECLTSVQGGSFQFFQIQGD